MSKKKITLRDVLDAMRKNGFKKSRGDMLRGQRYKVFGQTFHKNVTIDSPREDVKAGCALGQAAYNLQVNPFALSDALQFGKNDGQEIRDRIFHLNDETGKSLQEIADTIEIEYKDHLDKVVLQHV